MDESVCTKCNTMLEVSLLSDTCILAITSKPQYKVCNMLQVLPSFHIWVNVSFLRYFFMTNWYYFTPHCTQHENLYKLCQIYEIKKKGKPQVHFLTAESYLHTLESLHGLCTTMPNAKSTEFISLVAEESICSACTHKNVGHS